MRQTSFTVNGKKKSKNIEVWAPKRESFWVQRPTKAEVLAQKKTDFASKNNVFGCEKQLFRWIF